MSDFGTATAAYATAARTRLQRIGISLLPLMLFVGSMLGYEHLVQRRAASQPLVPTASSKPTADAAVKADSLAAGIRRRTAASDPANALLDERSLFELARIEAAREPLPLAAARSTPVARGAEPNPTHRALEVVPDSAVPLPLAIPGDRDGAPGAYAIVRGVPPGALLTHGIAVGDESWLIDGVDIPRTGIELPAGGAGKVVLDVAVLSGNSVLLHRESLTIEVRPPALPIVPVASVAPVRAPVARTVAPGLRISRDTTFVPGRSGLLTIEIEPASAIPHGAYVVLRGLPADTVMSRGFAMGPEAWLLTLAELAGLEVRLPAKATGSIHIVVKLVTPGGELIAEDQHEVALRTPAAAVVARVQPVQITPPAPVAAVRPAAAVGNVALARGRRMLEIGNFAVARPLLERAALEGSGDAAALLAATFDPAWLQKTGALGIAADATKARYWYDEARKLGVKDIAAVTGVEPRQ